MSALEAAIEGLLAGQRLITEDRRISKRLRAAVLELSDSFTAQRAGLRKHYFSRDEFRLAYMAGFMLTNAAKVAHCLSAHLELLPDTGPLSIVDVGCGPGTAIFAASELLARVRPKQDVRFVGVEANRGALGAAKALAANILPPHHRARWVCAEASSLEQRLGEERFNAAIAANLLNELDGTEQRRVLCAQLLEHADILFLIEPALKHPARGLAALRDRMVEDGAADIVAPCTHLGPCPMLAANARDWCHFYVAWTRPRLIEVLDHATGLDHRHLKMAYFVLASAARDQRPETRTPKQSPCVIHGSHVTGHEAWRAVSAPLQSRGKVELILCGGGGELRRIRRLDKNASPLNADFGHVQRGDLVRFTDAERPGDCRAEDRFDIVLRYNG